MDNALKEYLTNKNLSNKLKLNIRNGIITIYDKQSFYQYLLKEYRGAEL